MKKYLGAVLIVFLLSGCHQNVKAVNLKPKNGLIEDQEVSEMKKPAIGNKSHQAYSNFQKGDSFKSGREHFQFLPELYSVAQRNKNDLAAASNIANIQQQKSASLIEAKGGFSIYRAESSETMSFMSSQSLQTQKLYPVVLNTRTNKLGIVTGHISVVLENMDDAELIAGDLDLNIRKKYNHLKTVFFIVKEGQDILSLQQALTDDSRVKSAAIEVLENFYVPQ